MLQHVLLSLEHVQHAIFRHLSLRTLWLCRRVCPSSPKPFRVPLFAARTLNATGQRRVTLSLQ